MAADGDEEQAKRKVIRIPAANADEMSATIRLIDDETVARHAVESEEQIKTAFGHMVTLFPPMVTWQKSSLEMCRVQRVERINKRQEGEVLHIVDMIHRGIVEVNTAAHRNRRLEGKLRHALATCDEKYDCKMDACGWGPLLQVAQAIMNETERQDINLHEVATIAAHAPFQN